MSTASLLFVLGLLPSLPEELDYLHPPEPREPVSVAAAVAAPVITMPAAAMPAAPVKPAAPAIPTAAAAPMTPVASPPRPVPPRNPLAITDKLPFAGETTTFRVVYGVIGDLGEIKISYGFPDNRITASGSGSGSLFGIGRIEKRIEADLALGNAGSRRWVASRIQSGRTIVDTVDQSTPGAIAVLRHRSDRPDEGHRFNRQAPVLDPLAFLWRLRSSPPMHTETFEVLDGRALWTITLDATRVANASATRKVLILTGKANPIFWDGRPDDDRTARNFTLYLEGDAQHTPLRLVMPLALGEVRVELAAVSHRALTADLRATSPFRRLVGTAATVVRRALVNSLGQ